MIPLTSHSLSSLAGNVTADASFEKGGIVTLQYRWPSQWKIVGDPKTIKLPQAERRHGLWNSTCFEAFLRPQNEARYHEINLSPLHFWNAYLFDRYRKPVPPREAGGWNLLEMTASAGRLSARIQTDLPPDQELQIGLSCIIENIAGEKCYWSLGSRMETPDFHDTRCFLLTRSSL